jgi:hypothetical protein
VEENLSRLGRSSISIIDLIIERVEFSLPMPTLSLVTRSEDRAMSPAWHRRQPISFRPMASDAPLDTRFPRAVAGEEYERYARAMWPQAQRWIRKHWHRVAGGGLSIDDARDVLRSVAGIDLARRLYGQEERLLSELLQGAWYDLAGQRDVAPEIPSFLVARR